jgi:hypothetical protein
MISASRSDIFFVTKGEVIALVPQHSIEYSVITMLAYGMNECLPVIRETVRETHPTLPQKRECAVKQFVELVLKIRFSLETKREVGIALTALKNIPIEREYLIWVPLFFLFYQRFSNKRIDKKLLCSVGLLLERYP